MPLEDYPDYNYDADLAEAVRGLPPPRQRFIPPQAPPPAPPELGTLTDIAHGFKRGLFSQTPEMIAKAAEAFGGSAKWLRRYAEAQGKLPEQQVNEGGWGEAAANVVPSMSAGLLTAAAPWVGVPAAAALFGGSQFTDTQEKLQGEGIDSGTARAAALGTGVVEGAGEAALSFVGGKFLTGALGRLGGGVQGGLKSWASPGLIKPLAKGLAITAGAETAQEAIQQGAETAIERAAGAQNEPTPFEAATSVIGPTLRMTALMAPFGGVGTLLTNRARKQVAGVLAVPPADLENMSGGQRVQARRNREKALEIVYKDIQERGPEEAMAWRQEAMQAIFNDQPVSLDADFKFERPPSTPGTPGFVGPGTPNPIAPASGPDFTGPYPRPFPLDVWRGGEDAPMEGEYIPAGHYPNWTPGSFQQNQDWRGVPGRPLGTEWTFGRDDEGGPGGPGGPPAPGFPPVSGVPRLAAPDNPQMAAAFERAAVERQQRVAEESAATSAALSAQRQAEWDAAHEQRTKQENARAFMVAMPKATYSGNKILPRLMAQTDAAGVAAEIRKIWGEKISAKSPPKYVAELEAYHQKLTGRTIEEVLAEEQAKGVADERVEGSEAAPADTRTEPEPAAAAAGVETARVDQQVHEGAGDGATESTQPPEAAPVDADVTDLTQYRALDKATKQEAQSLISEARQAITTGQLTNEQVAASKGATPLDSLRNLDKLLQPIRNRGREGAANELTPKGVEDATQTGQQPEGSVGERIGTSEERQGPEAGGGDLAEQRSPDGTIKGQRNATSVSQAEAKVAEAKAALDAKQTEVREARKALSQHNNTIEQKRAQLLQLRRNLNQVQDVLGRGPHNLTPAQRERWDELPGLRDSLRDDYNELHAELQKDAEHHDVLKANIDKLLDERTNMAEFKQHSDAVGKAEKERAKTEPSRMGGQEPTESLDFWRRGLDENLPLDEQRTVLYAWLSTLKQALGKDMPDRMKAAMKALEGHDVMKQYYRPTTLSKEAAQLALDVAAKGGQAKRLNDAVEAWLSAFEFAKEKGVFVDKVKAADNIAAQRAAERDLKRAEAEAAQTVQQATDVETAHRTKLDAIAADLAAGNISQKEADIRTKAALDPAAAAADAAKAAQDRQQAVEDSFEQQIAAINERVDRGEITKAEANVLIGRIGETEAVADLAADKNVSGEVQTAADQMFDLLHEQTPEGPRLRARRQPDGTRIANDPELLHAAEQKAQYELDKLNSRNRGIAGLSDPALRERVQANPKAVAHMADIARRNNNPIIRTIAKLLASKHLTATVVEVENPDFKGGRYVPETDTIEIGQGGMNTLTLMHEAVHALTHNMLTEAIDNATRPFGEMTKEQQAGVSALREVRSLMKKFSKEANFDDPAHRIAMQSEHEFVSEALANPKIQWQLDSRNWFTKMFHKIAGALGFNSTMSTELEQLVKASGVFFGDPNVLSKEVYNRDPALGNTSGWLNSLASVSPKMAFGDALLQKDLPAKLLKQGLTWLTHNHVTQVLTRHIEQALRDYPHAEVALKALQKAWNSFRPIKDMADALSSYLSKEGSNINLRNTNYLKTDRKHAEMMFGMATEGSRLGIDPALKTFEAAKAANPDLTPEVWNSAGAQLIRAKYSKLETESARLTRLNPNADTPLKIYHDMRAKHVLDFSRAMANSVKTALQVFEINQHPALRSARYATDAAGREYDRLDIVAEPYRKLSVNEQHQRLSSGIHDVQQALTATLAAKMGVAEKDVNKAYALLQKNKAVPKDMVDLVAARETVNDIQGHYAYHQKVPYFHLGRSGDYVIKFTVGGGQAEWDRVGAVVEGADLNRAWGPPKGGADSKMNRDVYMRFDNALMFRTAEKKLLELERQGLFKHAETGATTWASGRVDESFRALEQSSSGFVNMMTERIRKQVVDHVYTPEVGQQLINDMKDAYFASLPESSPLKPKMFRDGDVGYSKDFVNTFADRLTMSKGSLVSSYTSPMTAATIKGLYDAKRGLDRTPGMGEFAAKVGLYTDELRGRMNDLAQPVQSPVIDKIRALPAAWRLMLSPAYMMTVGYTPIQITLPMIGKRYGFGDTASAMVGNYSKSIAALNALLKMGWADPNVQGLSKFDQLASLSELTFEFSKIIDKKTGLPMFTGNDLAALEHLQWSSLLNFGQTNQVARVNPEDKGKLSKFASMASVGPHYIEVLNRMVTMMTAYQMEMKKGSTAGGIEAQRERARQYGLQMVRDTDGDHSQTNLARKLGKRGIAGKLTPLFVGFGQFGIQQTELMFRELGNLRTGTPQQKKEAWRALGAMSATTGAAAGALGLPFVSLMTAMANEIGSWLGDDDDDPPDAQKAVRDALAGVFGEQGGAIISRGLPRIFDVDLSARSGLQDIAPFSEFLQDRRKLEDKLAHGALNLLGPAVGVGAGIWTGTRALKENNLPQFINDALPAEVRNLAKAYRIANYGYESTAAGNQVVIKKEDVTGWNIIAQSLGLQSAQRADISERTFAYHTNRQLLQARESVLRNNIYRAVDQQDYGEMERRWREAINFQRMHPEMGMDIAAGLKQRAKERAVAELSGTGILAAPRMYPVLQNYRFSGQQ